MFIRTIAPGDLQLIDECWLRVISDDCYITATRRGQEWETVILFAPDTERPDIITLSGDHRQALAECDKTALKAWILENEHKHPSAFSQALERAYASL